jgi:hypothetical protein
VHAPLGTYVDTFVPLPPPCIYDDKSTHSDHGSDLSSESDSEDDEPHQILKWEQSTIQEACDLVGDLADQRRMRS